MVVSALSSPGPARRRSSGRLSVRTPTKTPAGAASSVRKLKVAEMKKLLKDSGYDEDIYRGLARAELFVLVTDLYQSSGLPVPTPEEEISQQQSPPPPTKKTKAKNTPAKAAKNTPAKAAKNTPAKTKTKAKTSSGTTTPITTPKQTRKKTTVTAAATEKKRDQKVPKAAAAAAAAGWGALSTFFGGANDSPLAPWMAIWLCVSTCIVVWDSGFVLLRPASIRGQGFYAVFTPYQKYITVDKMYGEMGDNGTRDFIYAQTWANCIEICVAVLALYLNAQKRPSAVLAAYSVSLATMAKTILYAFVEMASSNRNTTHNGWADWLFFYIIPNYCWIVFPALICCTLAPRLLNIPNKK